MDTPNLTKTYSEPSFLGGGGGGGGRGLSLKEHPVLLHISTKIL